MMFYIQKEIKEKKIKRRKNLISKHQAKLQLENEMKVKERKKERNK